MATSTPFRTGRQVFVNHAAADGELIDRLAVALTRAGSTTIRTDELSAGGVYNATVRRALADSEAMVVPLSGAPRPTDLPASVMFETGAAVGAGKPVYVVVDSPTDRVPFGAPGVRVILANQVNVIGREISAGDFLAGSPAARRTRSAG